ncbi:MAG TPA: MGMT family protein [Tepidisphaeraceae bacterium]|nr:MGMT family protein [Tepidisphaeraceae bacterium]
MRRDANGDGVGGGRNGRAVSEHLAQILTGTPGEGMNFHERVWAVCCAVPKGKVTTYAAIARKLGSGGAFRAVGNALNKNPYAPRVPCHRVVGSDGSLTGFAGGLPKKKQLLVAEGVAFSNGKVDLAASGWEVGERAALKKGAGQGKLF